jgi:serine/threonine protein kinase
MNLPSGQDYREAVQHPAVCFSDPELRSGRPDLDSLQLPRVMSGNFASVFSIRTARARYAVRCFVQPDPERHRRYEAISKQLAEINTPWKVDFAYIERGIQVGNVWHPICRMEWIEGQSLIPWVERHLGHPAALRHLANQFATVLADLRSRGLAHGDLQHGNILITPTGQLRLIDYDGMFVPELNGLPSNELGHPNYQHPERRPDHFGPHLDHFSAWVIYVSLVTLSVEPALWQVLDGGDECLLLRKRDYDDPTGSPALDAMEMSLRDLAHLLRGLVVCQVPAVPDLDTSKVHPPPLPAASTTGQRLPGWMAGQMSAATATLAAGHPQPAQTGSSIICTHPPGRSSVARSCGPGFCSGHSSVSSWRSRSSRRPTSWRSRSQGPVPLHCSCGPSSWSPCDTAERPSGTPSSRRGANSGPGHAEGRGEADQATRAGCHHEWAIPRRATPAGAAGRYPQARAKRATAHHQHQQPAAREHLRTAHPGASGRAGRVAPISPGLPGTRANQAPGRTAHRPGRTSEHGQRPPTQPRRSRDHDRRRLRQHAH